MKRASLSVNPLFAGVALAAMLAAPAHADDVMENLPPLNLTHSVYLGGLHVMDSKADFNTDGKLYNIQLQAFTQGWLRRIAPWDAKVSASGSVANEEVHPRTASVVTIWQDDQKAVNLNFDKGKAAASFNPPEESKNEKVPDDMLNGALDPLSGIVQVLASFAYGKGCDQNIPIFDGHRRIDLKLKEAGESVLSASETNMYAGPATRCKVDFAILGGSRKDREGSTFWQDGKGQSGRPPAYIYLAQLRPDLPPMPVKAETSTIFGAVVVNLTGLDTGKPQHASR